MIPSVLSDRPTAVAVPTLALHRRFDAQAARMPDAIAVDDGERRLTYCELRAATDALAMRLRTVHGVERRSLVGVYAGNSIEAVVGILAILKTGAAFLPIDLRYPAARVQHVLRDSGCVLVITTGASDPVIFQGAETVAVPPVDALATAGGGFQELPLPDSSVDDPAYVIYTSGSTGGPKGCVLSQGNASSYVEWATEYYGVGPATRFAFFTSISFDLTITSIFAPLIAGGTVRAFPGAELSRVIEAIAADRQINTIKLTPTHLRLLLEFDLSQSQLRHLILGGEELKPRLLERAAGALGQEAVFYNEYGPTEATVGCIVWRSSAVLPQRSVPIGQPLPTAVAHLLREDGSAAPEGEVGEIAIGGLGVAQGYLNRVELTAARFAALEGHGPETVYRTGDLGRVGPAGDFEYLGRRDHQVKLRGFRVELGEIELRLARFDGVTEAVAVVAEAAGAEDVALHAFVTGRTGLDLAALKAELRNELPDYMVPATLVKLAEMPVNENGKIDRLRLTPAAAAAATSPNPAPVGSGGLEAELTAIWEAVLRVSNVGPNDNFFDRGGDSTKAIIMAARVKKLRKTELDLAEVFKHPTINGLISLLRGAEQKELRALTRADQRPYYPLSSAQERLLALQQFTLATTTYNVPTAVRFTGRIDPERIAAVMRGLVARHELLRTRFALEGQALVQRVLPVAGWELRVETRTAWDASAELARFVRPFDLLGGELFRAKLLTNGCDEALLLVDLHHTATDGHSGEVLMRDFASLYRGGTLPDLPLHYRDYAVWERERLADGSWLSHRAYWLDQFRDGVPVLELPSDFTRPAIQSYVGDRVNFTLAGSELAELKAFCRRQDATLYVGLLSFFKLLLHKWTQQADIVVGTPVSGRASPGLEEIVGVFVNSMPIRSRLEEGASVAGFCRGVKKAIVGAIAHQCYPVERLIADLNVARDLSRSPLFDVLFTFQERKAVADPLVELGIEPLRFDAQTAKYDLHLLVWEGVDHLDFSLEYCRRLFERRSIEHLVARYLRTLALGVAAPSCAVRDLDPTPLAEAELLRRAGTGPDAGRSRVERLSDYLADRAQRTPAAPALRWTEGEWDCAKLNRVADTVAQRLAADFNVGPGDIVGVISKRTPHLIAAIFGILKCGAAYLPLDVKCPRARLEYIVKDAGCALVLVEAGQAQLFAGSGLPTLDLVASASEAASGTLRPCACSSNDPAYVLYTSGSTGKPKGIVVEHRSAINLLEHMQREYPVRAGDSYLFKTAYTFDVSVTELFGWAVGDGALILMPEEQEGDPVAILDVVGRFGVTHINFVPAMFRTMLDSIAEDHPRRWPAWRHVMVAGEPFTEEAGRVLAQWGQAAAVENLYGPTEAAVYVTGSNLASWPGAGRVPIGRPVSATRAQVVDAGGRLCPIGATGELIVSGVQLARGYLNRPELTHERFRAVDGERAYYTGDVVRWSSRGDLEYLGRVDNQVKVRGYRIELGDVESALETLPGVTGAAAAVRLMGSEPVLCGYVTLEAPGDGRVLRERLKRVLPEYMIPSCVQVMDALPRTSSGKINRGELPVPVVMSAAPRRALSGPETSGEVAMVSIWSEVLGRAHVNVDDDFFELGGHSLSAVRICSQVRRAVGVEVAVSTLFQGPTIREFSRAVEQLTRRFRSRIMPAGAAERYPATSTQRRFYAACRHDPATLAFNIPVAIELRGGVAPARIRQAIGAVVRCHEVLRTTFELHQGELFQRVALPGDVPFEQVVDAGSELDDLVADFVRPFDLHRGPLLRARLVTRGPGVDWLFFDIHHIVCDGISISVLVCDFARAYRDEPLGGAEALHYKDYAVWLASAPAQQHLQLQKDYWLRKLAAALPRLDLPTDYARSGQTSFDGASLVFEIDAATTAALRTLCQRTRTTLNHALLAGLSVLLSKHSDQPVVVVGTTLSGRDDADVDQMMGCFINTLPVITAPGPHKVLADFLLEVRDECLHVLQHQTYPFDELVRALEVKPAAGRHPIFDVLFVYQTISHAPLALEGIDLSVLPIEEKTAKFDLTFMAWEDGDTLGFKLKYRVGLFGAATIAAFGERYLKLIAQMADQPNQELRHFRLSDDAAVMADVDSFNTAF